MLYGNELLKCAVKVDLGKMPEDFDKYYMEPDNRVLLRDRLPSHVQNCGPIVEVVPIFEVVEIK